MPFRFGLGVYEASVVGDLLDFGAFPFDVDADGLFELPVGTTFTDDLYDLDFFWEVPPWVKPKPWTLQLCHDAQTIATCTAFEFSGLLQRNQGGEWTLETSEAGMPPVGYPDPEGLEPGYVAFDPRDVTDIRLVAEGTIVYAGAVHGDNAGFYATQTASGEKWRLSGTELGWYRLGDRIVLPDPTIDFPGPWAVSHDERTGIASSVLAAYIEANAGSSALPQRQITGLDVADETVGASDDFAALYEDTLASLSTRIGNDYGFEVLPEYDFDGTITYRLSTPRDLSGVIVFSDQGDLLDSSARFKLRDATAVLTGGSGELTSRIFRSDSTGATGNDRHERFSDQGGLDTVGEVQADASASLVEAGEQFQMTTTLTDSLAVQAIGFGMRLGDRVGLIVRGRRYVAPIEAIQFEVTAARQTMRPRFGAAQPDEFRQLLATIHNR